MRGGGFVGLSGEGGGLLICYSLQYGRSSLGIPSGIST